MEWGTIFVNGGRNRRHITAHSTVAYGDYSTQTALITIGETNTHRRGRFGNDGDNDITFLLDWNQNGVFTDAAAMNTSSQWGLPLQVAGTINIIDTQLCNHRHNSASQWVWRIKSHLVRTDVGSSFGEYEDYGDAVPMPFMRYPVAIVANTNDWGAGSAPASRSFDANVKRRR